MHFNSQVLVKQWKDLMRVPEPMVFDAIVKNETQLLRLFFIFFFCTKMLKTLDLISGNGSFLM